MKDAVEPDIPFVGNSVARLANVVRMAFASSAPLNSNVLASTSRSDRFEFLRDDSLFRIHEQSGMRSRQQCLIVARNGCGRHDITEADVDLDGNARAVEAGGE